MNLNNKQALPQKSPLGKRSSAIANLGVAPSSHFKFCPRCAAPGHFNNERNLFKCESCGFQFFLNSAAAVAALIFNEKNELLMARRGIEPSIGMLDLPGGFVDPCESVESALMREIKEELNLVPSSIAFYGSFPNKYLFSGFTVNTVDMVFTCAVDTLADIKCMDDVAGIEFIKPEELNLDLVAFESAKNILKQLINERNNTNANR